MPFWRKKTLFISHAYDDEAALGKFKQTKLPKSATARIFPPIKVPPTERVSDDLLDAIRKSDGLVYFKTEVSLKSFWVVFEINYAHQLGLDVFAFDPETGKFHNEELKYSLDPLLSINWNLFVDRDELTVFQIAKYLHERHKFRMRKTTEDWVTYPRSRAPAREVIGKSDERLIGP